jgi:acyl-CoA synthetase (AMP-forming)/AMP-acid ligase II
LLLNSSVVLVYPPSLDFLVAFLACVKAHIIAVPVFPPNPLRRDTLNMFANIVANCEARTALTNQEYNHVQKMSSIQDTFKRKVSKAAATTASWPDALTWMVTDSKKNKAPSVSLPTSHPDPSNICFLQYTSGSTSEPKGVCITHGNLAHNLTIITRELQASHDTIVVSWLPQYHDMGLIGSYLGALYCGGSGYYLNPLTFLQRPMVWIEAMSAYRATHVQAPNFAYALTARKFRDGTPNVKLDLSSVRHMINAAEPVDAESIDTFYDTFGPYGLPKVIYPTYGLAEHTVFVCSGGQQRLTVRKYDLEVHQKVVLVTDAKDSNESSDASQVTHLVGCGYPSHQKVTVKIVQPESFAVLSEDEVGEIWIQSPSKAAGYYHKAQDTQHDFHAHLQGEEAKDEKGGYLRTGDLGFLHHDELFICGRLKDLIIVGGRNYYPVSLHAASSMPGCIAFSCFTHI